MSLPEKPREPDATADARRLLEAELGDQTHLARERDKLPELLASSERLLSVEATGLRSGRAGILAVTDRRLIHIYWGYFRQRLRVTSIGFDNVDTVRTHSHRRFARVIVRMKRVQRTAFLPSRTVGFPLGIVKDAGAHAEEVATAIRNGVRSVQEAEPVKTGNPPLKSVG